VTGTLPPAEGWGKRNLPGIECFLLVAFLAYNLFHAFFALNLKPAARRGTTQRFWARNSIGR
jgi:hypothetical protein